MRHIYVHVPFCARRCSYCDFAIAVRKRVPGDRYVAAILDELRLRRQQGQWDSEALETLYLGGGTPSLLPPDRLSALIGALHAGPGAAAHPPAARPAADLPPGVEITIEANPDDVTAGAARAWVRAGVSRVSLGAQSFDPTVLQWMHRTHGPEATPRAVAILREAGVADISLDLIFGLPQELRAEFRRDVDRAVALGPEHLSVYGLSVESRTPLARWISRGSTTPPSEDRYAADFLLAHEVLTGAGFEHYEVSNYALPGHRSRHNSAYWSGRAYVGLGPAAHSYRPHESLVGPPIGSSDARVSRGAGAERRWNLAPWAAYDRAVARGQDPTDASERLTPGQSLLERLYLGLRTAAGVEVAPWWSLASALERAWVDQGWLTREGGRVRLTPVGWLRLDLLVGSLTTSADSG